MMGLHELCKCKRIRKRLVNFNLVSLIQAACVASSEPKLLQYSLRTLWLISASDLEAFSNVDKGARIRKNEAQT
jgi:hypothetical protein